MIVLQALTRLRFCEQKIFFLDLDFILYFFKYLKADEVTYILREDKNVK